MDRARLSTREESRESLTHRPLAVTQSSRRECGVLLVALTRTLEVNPTWHPHRSHPITSEDWTGTNVSAQGSSLADHE